MELNFSNIPREKDIRVVKPKLLYSKTVKEIPWKPTVSALFFQKARANEIRLCRKQHQTGKLLKTLVQGNAHGFELWLYIPAKIRFSLAMFRSHSMFVVRDSAIEFRTVTSNLQLAKPSS